MLCSKLITEQKYLQLTEISLYFSICKRRSLDEYNNRINAVFNTVIHLCTVKNVFNNTKNTLQPAVWIGCAILTDGVTISHSCSVRVTITNEHSLKMLLFKCLFFESESVLPRILE